MHCSSRRVTEFSFSLRMRSNYGEQGLHTQMWTSKSMSLTTCILCAWINIVVSPCSALASRRVSSTESNAFFDLPWELTADIDQNTGDLGIYKFSQTPPGYGRWSHCKDGQVKLLSINKAVRIHTSVSDRPEMRRAERDWSRVYAA